METWVHKEEKYQGKIFSLWVGEVQLDDGQVFEREVVSHKGGVAIVPVLGDAVILIRQFRISIGCEILELPAGRLEENETPETCAHRELEEETGYRAGKLDLLASFYPSAGYTSEKVFVFLADQLQKTEDNLEPDERIRLIHIPIAELEDRLANREFEDSKVIIGLRELLARLKR